jgi:hypothetical protein
MFRFWLISTYTSRCLLIIGDIIAKTKVCTFPYPHKCKKYIAYIFNMINNIHFSQIHQTLLFNYKESLNSDNIFKHFKIEKIRMIYFIFIINIVFLIVFEMMLINITVSKNLGTKWSLGSINHNKITRELQTRFNWVCTREIMNICNIPHFPWNNV